jgi:phosphate transport system permease protein
MSAVAPQPAVLKPTRRWLDRVGDRMLLVFTVGATLLVSVILALIAWKIIEGSWPAIKKFGISFIWSGTWNPVTNVYGAGWFIIGTIVTSFGALLLAAPLSIGIGLYLSELAPSWIKAPVTSLVEMLAAVPSVVIGLWGIIVLGPFMRSTIDPILKSVLGWTPFFSGTASQTGMLVAIVVLTMMAIPITSSICRELFASVPRDLKEAAVGLGATRWEMVRGVVIPQVRGGIVAGIMLGLGRALGEAIAVTQVIGNSLVGLHLSLFDAGNTIASQLASNYQGAGTNIEVAALFYLALILLVITFVTNYLAQLIVRRFDAAHGR